MLEPFSTHFNELRTVLIKMGLIIGISFIFLFLFSPPFFHFLIVHSGSPHAVAKEKIVRERLTNRSSTPQSYQLPEGAVLLKETEQVDKEDPLPQNSTHSACCFGTLPPHGTIEYERVLPEQLYFLGPLEGIFVISKLSFWGSLLLSAPLWGWMVLKFVSPALKPQEKALVIPFILGSYLAASAGFVAAYWIAIPWAKESLEQFNSGLGLNAWSAAHYSDFILLMLFAHACAFEICFLLFWLVHRKIVSASWLSQHRPWFIVTAFILGALLTPPDVPSQLMLALPLILLFEISILYGKFVKLQVSEPSI